MLKLRCNYYEMCKNKKQLDSDSIGNFNAFFLKCIYFIHKGNLFKQIVRIDSFTKSWHWLWLSTTLISNWTGNGCNYWISLLTRSHNRYSINYSKTPWTFKVSNYAVNSFLFIPQIVLYPLSVISGTLSKYSNSSATWYFQNLLLIYYPLFFRFCSYRNVISDLAGRIMSNDTYRNLTAYNAHIYKILINKFISFKNLELALKS